MSVSGILSSLSQNQLYAANTPFQQSIQQLGKDLQSGNSSSAQSDFATLQQAFSQSSATSTSTSDLVAQPFKQLATDVQSGNISASQKDLSALQQNIESRPSASTHRAHNNYRMRYAGTGTDGLSSLQSAGQPGQPPTPGSLSAVQQAYALQGETALSASGGLHQAEPPVSGPPVSLEA